MEELTRLTASELAGMLRRGEVSSVEVTEQVLARIERLNPILGAFVTVTGELALEQAREADERHRRGEYLSVMDGIPYSIKDLDDTAGIRSTHGSRFMRDHVPDRDSANARILRSSGGVLLGKTNTPHMGYKDMSDNLVAPTAVNPWNTSTTPGGSSGGAASALAGRLGPLAHGSDGAGSIRIPASLTGTVGLKPTFGRVPFYPKSNPWTSRSHNGPMARTVADVALMLSVMAQPDDRDPASVHLPLEPFAPADTPRPLTGTRALFSPDFGYGRISREVDRITRSAVEALRLLGCEVVEERPAWSNPAEFHAVLYGGGGYPEAFRAHPEWVEQDFGEMLERGSRRAAQELVAAEAARAAFYDEVTAVMTEFDFIVSPTMPFTAWSAMPGPGRHDVDGVELDAALSRAFLVYPFNLTGQPAVSLPSGLAEDGLPVGVQIVGRKYADIAVLEAAAALERELDLRLDWPEPTERPAEVDAHLRGLSA